MGVWGNSFPQPCFLMPRIIFATFEGGGHVTPAAQLARRLQADGATLRFLSDEASRAAAAGLPFHPWRRAPNRQGAAAAATPLRDHLAAFWPPAAVRSLCAEVMCEPALAYAQDLLAAMREQPADLIVANELLLGAMLAGEAAGVPVVSFSANIWPFPTRDDLPPFGPGFRPGTQDWHAKRDAFTRDWTFKLYDAGLPALNAARAALGLPPLAHVLDQLQMLRLSLLGTARAFDFDRPAVPPSFAYAGPMLETPPWAAPWLPRHARPHVLVSFSTTQMGQTGALRRSLRALHGLPVQGVLTAGPAIDPAGLPAGSQVQILRGAAHDDILPHCAAAIVQGGHGSVIRPLLHGVPLLALPLGRDNADNAARVAEAGAGIALSGRAGAWRIRRALRTLLAEPAYRQAAAVLGRHIAVETDGGAGASARLLRLVEA